MKAEHLTLVAVLVIGCSSGDPKPNKPGDDGAAAPATSPRPPVELDIVAVDEAHYVLGEDAILHLAANVAAGEVSADLGPSGLVLGRVAPDGALAQLGLAAGDIITRVDGSGLASFAELRERYQQSAKRGHLEVELTRGGATLRRTFHWRAALPERRQLRGEWTDADRALAAAIDTGVRKAGDDLYEVDVLIVRALAKHPELLDRCQPGYARGGTGVDVIDGPTVCRALGIGPYDTIKMVNDIDARSARSLTQAFAGLGETDFSISLVRLTEPHLVRYRVVRDVVMDAQLDKAVADVLALPADVRRPRPDNPSPPSDGITRIDDTTYEIDRSVIEDFVANPDPRAFGRIVPSIKNGQPDGVKLYAIRPSSLGAALGLRNGDTIQRVGGVTVNSASDAPAIRDEVRGGGTITVSIRRRGQALEIEYTIR